MCFRFQCEVTYVFCRAVTALELIPELGRLYLISLKHQIFQIFHCRLPKTQKWRPYPRNSSLVNRQKINTFLALILPHRANEVHIIEKFTNENEQTNVKYLIDNFLLVRVLMPKTDDFAPQILILTDANGLVKKSGAGKNWTHTVLIRKCDA